MAGAVGLFVGVSTGGCATISGNSRLTGLRSHFGHWLCSRQHGTDSGGVDLAPERAGCAGSNLSACSVSEQTNKQLLYSVRDTRRYLSGLVRPHCVALVAIYTNIQISVGWFFGLGSLQMMVTYTRVLLATGTHLWTMFASKSLCRSLYSVSTCS